MKYKIPSRVIKPIKTKFKSTSECAITYRSGLGYAILRALGAHDGLSDDAVNIVIKWSNTFHESNSRITPHSNNLKKTLSSDVPLEDWFRKRVGPDFQADLAAPNAASFPGNGKRPSYESIYHLVWEDQKWPELCKALSE